MIIIIINYIVNFNLLSKNHYHGGLFLCITIKQIAKDNRYFIKKKIYFLKCSLSIDRFGIEKRFRCSNVQYNDIDTDNIQNLIQRWHALEFHFNE